MHFLYIDEAGTSGTNLTDSQQPVFVMAGVLVSDEKWRKTELAVASTLSVAFKGIMPPNFELHAHQLLSPKGEGPFEGWERERRNKLASDLLTILTTEKHSVFIQIIHKKKMGEVLPPPDDYGFNWNNPWELGFHCFLTKFEEFLRSPKTGRTSSGLVIIDHDDQLMGVVRGHSKKRQQAKGWRELKKVVEIGYSAASHANPMVQLTDLVAFTMKKWAESQIEFSAQWPSEAHEVYQQYRTQIWSRTQFKELRFNMLKVPSAFTTYLTELSNHKETLARKPSRLRLPGF